MHTINDVHQQFAAFFKSNTLQPYAYLLSKKLGEGHICIRLDELDEDIGDLPLHYHAIIRHDIAENFKSLRNEFLVAAGPGERKPFVLYNNCLYLQRYFFYESRILERIRDFCATEETLLESRAKYLKDLKDLINSLFGGGDKGKDAGGETKATTDWQQVAAISAVLNNFTIITGGPGTGKTTTVAKILSVLYTMNKDLRIALTAPTGKAAARMAESLKQASLPLNEPTTLHRLLMYSPATSQFIYNEKNPLPYDVVIADEASMIDAALFARLLDATGPSTRLILLGDKDQLASVEAGSLFGDLCQGKGTRNLFSNERASLINSFITDASRIISGNAITAPENHLLFQHVIELTVSHRFNAEEGIGRFAKAVISGNESVIKSFTEKQDHRVGIDTAYSREVFERFVDGYAAFIMEKDTSLALQKLNELRVLCAVREGEYGLYQLNRKIERYLEQKRLIRATPGFYENRPVMVTANNYAAGLFNGDTGIARADEKGTMRVWFEDAGGGLKSVLPGYINQAETVFAMTVHKSQGSEFEQVLIVLPPDENIPILTRELLYTAVTRARSNVIIQAPEQVILTASGRLVKRASGIEARFGKEKENYSQQH